MRETERLSRHCTVVTRIVRDDITTRIDDRTVVVSERVFEKLSRRRHPDGFAAVLAVPSLSPWPLHVQDDSLILVADGIEKPGNVGAMMRTADAFGAAFVGASLGTDVVNPNVIRASQGSLFARKTASAPRGDIISWLSAAGMRTVSTSPDATERLWDADMTGPVAIVIGAEDVGVDPAWKAHVSVSIPMSGTADSLNASVSAAILLAEAARQRSE